MGTSARILRVAALLLRIILGGIFINAAYTKLKLPWQVFAMGIDSYKILPEKGVELAARILAGAELVVGVLLIVGRFMRLSSAITSGLLVLFFGLMVRAYAKG